jgi:hypothetical protein
MEAIRKAVGYVLPRVSTEMGLHVLAYNLKRAMQIIGSRR